ncbi:MAG: zinc ribbon domain-containing protein [Myxococcales bacterium]|nr:zinc ribbon domain-containing protein [Myxococcales bacterium]
MSGVDAELAERRERRRQARLLALRLLRASKTPEQVIERLRRDGFGAEEAERVVVRADDSLQRGLNEGARGSCGRCAAVMDERAAYCEACGAKVPDASALHYHRTELEPRLARGRKWLGIMSFMYALWSVVFGLIPGSWFNLAVNMVLAAIQFGLWRWATKKLLPAAVTSLVLYATLLLVDAVADPASLFKGIVIKVFFVGFFVGSIRAGLEARAHGTGSVA